MRSAAHLLLLAAFLLFPVLTANAAWASDWVEGKGYRFRLPPEFVPIKDVDLAGMEDADQILKMANSMLSGSGVDIDAQVFLRQRGIQPDAFLFVMAMHLEGEMKEALRGRLSLSQLERQMHQLQTEADRQGLPLEVRRVRRILVSAGHDALEVELEVDDPKVGDLNTARMLFVLEEEMICMLGFQGTRESTTEDGSLWRAIVTSFRLEEQGSLLNLLMRYGPFILGGLVLLSALLFLRKSSTQKLIEPVGPATASAAEGGGAPFSRALDGLPVYGQAGGGMRELDGDPIGEMAPLTAVPVGPTSSGPRKVPTIPRVAPAAEAAMAGGGGLRRPGSAPHAAAALPLEPTPSPIDHGHGEVPPPSGGPSGLPRKFPGAPPAPPTPPAPPPRPQTAPPPLPPEPPAPFARPPAPPPSAQPGPTPSPAVAERIEMPMVDDRAGCDQPTNVALRDATASVPESDSSEEVLSRLMGFDEAPPPDPAPAPLRKIARADADPRDEDGVKIKRNSDFYE